VSDPKVGDIVREKKYAQPLEVTRVLPPLRQVETAPQTNPNGPKTWHDYDNVIPYKKEG
jgi:hypothetical protein